ncbi:hypothetical protein LXA43DRAFT_891310 [Ganoderma leucocontextum]|nr:hypothetical protein LXA43DRAFT_891310 [Ganoderma leucocontextum]
MAAPSPQSYQHRFRVNPQRSYSERMTQTRSDLRNLVKQKLCEITGESNAQMRWSRAAYIRDVVSRYRVRIEGWPLADVPFKNLSDVPNLGKLELLLTRWMAGTTYFRAISQAEYDAMILDPSPWIGVDEVQGAEGPHGANGGTEEA